MEELTVAGRALSYNSSRGVHAPNAGVAAKMLEWARDAATRDAASEESSDGHAPDATSSLSVPARTISSTLLRQRQLHDRVGAALPASWRRRW